MDLCSVGHQAARSESARERRQPHQRTGNGWLGRLGTNASMVSSRYPAVTNFAVDRSYIATTATMATDPQRSVDMQDHLKAARTAGEMTDMQLISAWSQVADADNLTCEEQAVRDEMVRRDIDF